MKTRLYTDGGARGNPGPAAAAYVLETQDGHVLAAHGEAIGVATRPDWVEAIVAVALGWIGISVLPQLVEAVGVTAVGLAFVGGALYTAGALVYACRRPDPVPAVFGYHELFHALVIVAAACQYAAIASLL